MNHDPVEKGTECCLSVKCLLTNSPEEYSKRRLTLLGTAEKLVFVMHLHCRAFCIHQRFDPNHDRAMAGSVGKKEERPGPSFLEDALL